MTDNVDPKLFLLQRFSDKMDEIDAAWSSLRDASWQIEVLQRLRNLLRALASSGAVFGFRKVVDGAYACTRILEPLLKSDTEATPEEKSQVGTGLAALKLAVTSLAAVNGLPSKPESLPVAPGERDRSLFLVMDNTQMATEVARRVHPFGYCVHAFSTLDEMSRAIHKAPPCAVLLDIVFVTENGVDTITHLQNIHTASAALLFISTRTDLDARLHAVRAGGDAYFTLPLDINLLINKLDQLTALSIPEPLRILVIDDSSLGAQHHASILQQAGMHTQMVTQTTQVITALIEFRPDLILLDLYMPKCDGLELATVIRQKQDYVGVPIVFLSGEANLEKQLAAMSLGADDFLVKPIVPAHLVAAVTHRAQRARVLRSFMIRDSLTKLLNHVAIKEQLELEILRARRKGASLAFGILDLDHFKSVNDQYGHVTGDQVIKNLARLLQRRLRGTDVIGRYGGEEFAIVLTDVDAAQAVAVVDQLRSAFEDMPQLATDKTFSVTFSCGIATFPAYPDAIDLTQAADKALYEAKRLGRNRIVMR